MLLIYVSHSRSAASLMICICRFSNLQRLRSLRVLPLLTTGYSVHLIAALLILNNCRARGSLLLHVHTTMLMMIMNSIILKNALIERLVVPIGLGRRRPQPRRAILKRDVGLADDHHLACFGVLADDVRLEVVARFGGLDACCCRGGRCGVRGLLPQN